VDAPTEQDEKKLWRVLMYRNCEGTKIARKHDLEVQGLLRCQQNGKVILDNSYRCKCSTHKSSKQKMVTRDPTVAFIGYDHEVIEVNDFLKSQSYEKGKPLVWQDNFSMLCLVEANIEQSISMFTNPV
jgi:hypothetical protein